TEPRVSTTCTRTMIGAVRLRTGFGENFTLSITSCVGSDTLVTGIEYLPLGSLIAPSGSGPPPPPLAVTTAVAFDCTIEEPEPFDAVTRTRRVCPTSSEVSVRLDVVAPEIVLHELPFVSHRSHW